MTPATSRHTEQRHSGDRALWQQALVGAVRSVAELLSLVEVPFEAISEAYGLADPATVRAFPLVVPRGFVSRMRKGDPFDPLLRQVLPIGVESAEVEGFLSDPVGDQDALVAAGVLHKYYGRVLFVVTGTCGVHCRYCFRREFPYQGATTTSSTIDAALEYVAEDRTIKEVILSGGDPLTLPDRQLEAIVARVEAIPHVQRLRIHSRMPIVIPERITNELVDVLAGKRSRLSTVVVLHVNHANEIDTHVRYATMLLRKAGMVVLNQSVLLRGVNDDASALRILSEQLFDMGVLPYYLHLLDRVRGSAHFEVSESRARALVIELIGYLPGYLVPRLVREVPGLPFKQPVDLQIGDPE